MTREEFKELFTQEPWINDEEYEEMIEEVLKGIGGLSAIEEAIMVGIGNGVDRKTQMDLFKGIVNSGVKR